MPAPPVNTEIVQKASWPAQPFLVVDGALNRI